MAKHLDDFEIDPVIAPIEDGRDTSPVAVKFWIGGLDELETVELGEGVVADLVRELREHGEA